MTSLILLPQADPNQYGAPVLPLGTRVSMRNTEWRLLRFTGHQLVFERHDHLETLPLSWNQYVHAWETMGLRIIPSPGAANAAKLRLAEIPFEYFGEKTQKTVQHKEYYCKKMHEVLLNRTLRCRSKEDIIEWLKHLPFDDGYTAHPSRGTVERDYRFWVAAGFRRGVLAHGNTNAIRESVFGQIVVDIIYDTLEAYRAPTPSITLESAKGLIANEIGRRIADGELICDRIPAVSTIARYEKKLNKYLVVQLQDGTYEADRQLQPKGKIVIPDFPMSRWEIDHTLLPVKVAFEAKDAQGNLHRIVIGQVWCTAVIDCATRFVLALVFGIDGPSSLRTMRAVRMAISPKSQIFIDFEIENRCDICLLPVTAVTDNGKDLHCGDLAAVFADLTITQHFAGAYKGEHKPFIERFIRTFKAYLRKIPGAQKKGMPRKGPKRRDVKEPKYLSLAQLERVAWKFVYDTYHTRPHPGLQNNTPLRAMLQGIQRLEAQRSKGYPAPLRPFSQYSALDIEAIFSIRKTLNVDGRGVRYKNLFWNSGALRQLGVKQIPVRIPPFDLGSILAISPKNGEYIRVPNTQPLYAVGLSLPVHKRVCARIIAHAKTKQTSGRGLRVPDLPTYLRNECALLHEVFAMVGLPKVPVRRLRDGVAHLGYRLDIALAVARADAIDVASGRVPPHLDEVIDLEQDDDATYTMQPKDVPAKAKRKEYQYPAEPEFVDDDEAVDLTVDPIAGFEDTIR